MISVIFGIFINYAIFNNATPPSVQRRNRNQGFCVFAGYGTMEVKRTAVSGQVQQFTIGYTPQVMEALLSES